MIDGGRLYDWLRARGVTIEQWESEELIHDRWWTPAELDREEFAGLFRRYVAELTDRE